MALDAELSIEHLAAEPEGVGGNHAARISGMYAIRAV